MKNFDWDENYPKFKSDFFSYAFVSYRDDYFTYDNAKRFLTAMGHKVNEEQLKHLLNICGQKGWIEGRVIYEPTFLLIGKEKNEIEKLFANANDLYPAKVAKALKQSDKKEFFTFEEFVAQNFTNKKDTSKIKEVFDEFEKLDLLKKKYVFFPKEKFFKDFKDFKIGRKFAPHDDFLLEK